MDTKKVLDKVFEAQWMLEEVAEIIRQAKADEMLDTIDPKALIMAALKDAMNLIDFSI